MSDRPDPQALARAESPTQVTYEGRRPVLVVRRATLRVVAGPDRGASLELGGARVTLGTGADCTLVLGDPQVSRHHLEVQTREDGYLVRDLGSTNGTFYRGAGIGEALLTPGAELRLGTATVLRVERGEEHSLQLTAQSSFGSLVGSSPPMQELYSVLAAVAPTDTTVLVLGETGTGKELVAQELHGASPRRDKPFLVLDCGSIPGQLIESELFGHERGAFTGADRERVGIFEQAAGGTVFLDEIGELPLEMQTRLLRVLDQRTVRRIGSGQQRPVDLRVVAATHRDLAEAVREGRFRQDLYFRLSVIVVRLPPLRDRRQDIPLLARHFLRRAGFAEPDQVLTPGVLEVLSSRSWPGNARELRNVVERAVVLADSASPLFTEEHRAPEPLEPRLSAAVAGAAAAGAPPAETGEWLARAMPPGFLDRAYKDAKEELVSQFERLLLGHLVARHGTNISRIATDAGVDRHLVRKLLRKHGMLPESEDTEE